MRDDGTEDGFAGSLGAGTAHALVERAAGQVRDGVASLRLALEAMPECGGMDLAPAFDPTPSLAAAARATDLALAEMARLRHGERREAPRLDRDRLRLGRDGDSIVEPLHVEARAARLRRDRSGRNRERLPRRHVEESLAPEQHDPPVFRRAVEGERAVGAQLRPHAVGQRHGSALADPGPIICE
jgi:hypothetical protein